MAIPTYKVYRRIAGGGAYTNIATVTGRTYTDAAVTPGITYDYVVTEALGGGETAYSSVTNRAVPDFTPTFWFKADEITGFANNAVLTAWPDHTNNHYNATTNSGSEPHYQTAVQNSLPGVLFAGLQPIILPQAADSFASGISVLIVVKNVASSGVQYIFNRAAGGAGDELVMRLINGTLQVIMLIGSNTSNQAFNTSISLTNTETAIIGLIYNNSVVKIYKNGVLDTGGAITPSPGGAIGTTPYTYVNAPLAMASVGGMNGYVLELIGDQTGISGAEFASRTNYLKTKWGIA